MSLPLSAPSGADDVADTTQNVIIIGSGPAGLTAAVYAARANLEPLLVEGMVDGGPTGGQLTLTTDVENFPGFPDGVMGPELIQNMRQQAEKFGTRFLTEDIVKAELSERPIRLETASGRTLTAHSLIIATGAKPRRLDIPGEDELWGAGVSACATCDGFFYREKEVAVIGGGDSALEEAIFLTKFASKVTIVHRRDEFRGSKILQDRVFANDRIEVAWNSVVDRVNGTDGLVSSLTLSDTETGEQRDLPVDGMFLAIGHIPNTWLFDGQLDTDATGYLQVEQPSTRTKVPGVFACGDVMDDTYRQAVTAAGTGCRAALDAERYLTEVLDEAAVA